MRRKNLDRRNGAGGLGCGERTVRKGGWVRLGDDLFYSPRLEPFAGHRVYITGLDDAFGPEHADCQLTWNDEWITLDSVYALACTNQLPSHLEFLRPRLGKLTDPIYFLRFKPSQAVEQHSR